MLFSSLTRISDLATAPFETTVIDRAAWRTGDYVVGRMLSTALGPAQLELQDGRHTLPMAGDLVVGAFGVRHATLESVGSWEAIGDDLSFQSLTGAGIFGRETSKSRYSPTLLSLKYVGHATRGGNPLRMRDYAVKGSSVPYRCPTVLVVGTSMSAGKTMSAKVIIRRLKVDLGLKVVGVKLTGAGRYRDILSMRDAGADAVFDFVDAGLPSSICPEAEYREALMKLLSRIQQENPGVVIAEAGASPLEPYNGETVRRQLEHVVKLRVLCATDPYAVVGVMKGYKFRPDLVTGVATNNVAGVELVRRLTDVPALNLIDRASWPELVRILKATFGQESSASEPS